MSNKVGVEIGGTFTDLVWLHEDGSLVTGKVPSTPGRIHLAVENALSEAGVALADVGQFTHGSTVATNALLTRKGARTGLVTTQGFCDILEIGSGERSGSIYNILYRKPIPPVPRSLVVDVSERITADGEIRLVLDVEEAWQKIEKLLEQGVTAIAICLLHAYRNPIHEKALLHLIQERAPHIDAFASHEVSPEFREFERAMTTSVNAFVGPVVSEYIGDLEESISQGGYAGILQVMQSNGGVMPASAAGKNAVRMLLSGPAAGVQAGIWFARRNDLSDMITLDMGGTSTDVAIASGLAPRMVSELKVDELPIRTAAVDIVTVGAGGGSIAAVDVAGLLCVGPQSAGAVPGPACYGRGGTAPTVTDAQVISGLLRPNRFFGGKMELRTDLARNALNQLAIDGKDHHAADAILRIVNANMASAVRLVSTSRGIDPRSYCLVAVGGGGPLHGALVAEEIGIKKVLIPWSPGLASAFGLLVADVVIDVVRTRFHKLSDETFGEAALAEFVGQCAEAAVAHGLAKDTYVLELGLDLRYEGQAFELTVWSESGNEEAASLRKKFEQLHKRRYGYYRATLPVEVVNYRARIIRRADTNLRTSISHDADKPREQNEIFFRGQWMQSTFVSRESLAPGDRLPGPAVVEEATSTTFVPPGWALQCLPSGDLLLEALP